MKTKKIQGRINRFGRRILRSVGLSVLTQFTLLMLLAVPFSAFAANPVISFNPAVAVFVTGAYVSWETDIASTSRIDYGTTTAYGSNVSNASSVTHHVLTITELSANTTYHYKVTSGATVSPDYTFTTYANPTGTVRTVGSGKTYSTIQACVNAMNAGDTCLVYAGTYSGAVTVGSGTAGNYKTILAQEAATISGTITVTSRNYSAVKGFQITGSGVRASAAATYITIESNYFNDATVSSVGLYACDWWIIRNNLFYGGEKTIMTSGLNVLIEGNDASHNGNDFFYGGLTNSVVRNNKNHDYAPSTQDSGHHVDFYQDDGSNLNHTVYTLFEGNTVQRCIDSTHNCHVVILRDPISTPHNIIYRYNFAQKIDGEDMLLGTNEGIYSNRIYNNTIAIEQSIEDGVFSSYYANYTKSLNNIAYNSCGTSNNCFDTGTGIVNNYNVQRSSANPTATWGSDYQSEATYSTLKNLDPTFINYPYSYAIASTSPVIDKGGNLTTVTSGCGTSTLTLADVRWFQPGWAGTQGDTLAIGSTVAGAIIAQLTGISYSATPSVSSGTVTFGSTVGCTNGDKVWLYAKSDGVRVLYGTAPDIGAYEYYGAADSAPSAPRGFTIQ